MNAIFLDHLDADLDHLRRMNELVARAPGAATRRRGARRGADAAVAPSRRSPSEDLALVAQRFAHRMPRLLRYVLDGLGTPDAQSADLMSYLLFDAAYTRTLVDIGYRDASARIAEIEAFLIDSGALFPDSGANAPRARIRSQSRSTLTHSYEPLRTFAKASSGRLQNTPSSAGAQAPAPVEHRGSDTVQRISRSPAEVRCAVQRAAPEHVVGEEQERAVAEQRLVGGRGERDRLARARPDARLVARDPRELALAERRNALDARDAQAQAHVVEEHERDEAERLARGDAPAERLARELR